MINTYEVTIDNYGHSGEGVGRVNGRPVFVSGALAGERLLVTDVERKKTYSRARIIKILEAAAERVEPKCGIYERCGGCQLQHMNYSEQLAMKRQSVVNAITRIGGLTDEIVGGITPCEPEWQYRNKMQLPVQALSGKLECGFFAAGTHRIIAMDTCPIQHPDNDAIAAVVKRIAAEMRLQPYDERARSGWLRHIAGRVGVNSGECMVILVTATELFHQKNEFVRRVRAELPRVVSIIQNINTDNTNVVFGKRERLLWGAKTISERLCGLNCEIGAQSFFQVNSAQAEKLYTIAKAAAKLNPDDILLDAYCGTGAIGLFMADSVKRVIGIEIVQDAVHNARRNAERNNIRNAEYFCGDVGTVLADQPEENDPTVVVIDPPRTGCSEAELLLYTGNIRPERIVYVSCNPATLARDLKILCNGGYTCRSVTPVDMFPQTYHVECVAALERVSDVY